MKRLLIPAVFLLAVLTAQTPTTPPRIYTYFAFPGESKWSWSTITLDPPLKFWKDTNGGAHLGLDYSQLQLVFVPYKGAGADVDLGGRNLIANQVTTTQAGPGTLTLQIGPCPTTAPANFATLCIEAGSLYFVDSNGKHPSSQPPVPPQ